jgi:hypothetical protein
MEMVIGVSMGTRKKGERRGRGRGERGGKREREKEDPGRKVENRIKKKIPVTRARE